MATPQQLPKARATPVKALLFDLMGTCLDWHSSILPLLESSPPHPNLPPDTLPQLALDWRAGFFEEIHQRFERKLPAEDIDITHRRVLDTLLERREVGLSADGWGEATRERLVQGWHKQRGWPEVKEALDMLRRDFFLVVLANGTTRLQLDLAKSSDLPFHMLLSSQLLGLTKPDPAIYRKALELLQVQPHECLMVAAHAYDLRAAKAVGIKTAYIQRTTEDLSEDMDVVREDVDIFIDGTTPGKDRGWSELIAIYFHL